MFWTAPLSIIQSFSLYTQQWYMSYTGLLTACEQEQDGPQVHPEPARMSETCRVLFQK